MILRTSLIVIIVALYTVSLGHGAVPKADVGSFNIAVTPIPSENLKAKVKLPKFKAPAKPWRVPPIPMTVQGSGVSIYYLLPYDRVASIIPKELKPIPGPDKIWFRVDFIKWEHLLIKDKTGNEKKVKPFLELDYRFEVLHEGRKGTYPLQIQMNKKYAVLWARKFGNYPSFQVKVAYANFSPFIHLFQFRNTELATAVVEANPLQGIGASMHGILNRRENAELWQGEGLDFVYDKKLKSINPIKKRFVVDLVPASLETILLRDPLLWQLLGKDEVTVPAKVFILESITGEWFGTQ